MKKHLINMKKWYHAKKGIIALVVIVVALTALMFAIIFNWCDLKNESNTIVTLVGIVLAYISIFLSYKSLMVTNQVKEDVALQQYKIKQQEVVAELVNDINTFDFHIDFFKDGKKDVDNAMFHRVNLGGVLELSDTHKEYNSIELFLDADFSFSPARLCGRSFMPPRIAQSLSRFLQSYPKESTPFRRSFTNAIIFRPTDFDTEKLLHSTKGIYVNWGTFVSGAKDLVENIIEWYCIEYGNSTPNFISRDLVLIETEYQDKKYTLSGSGTGQKS